MPSVAEALVAFIALYPVVTAALWIAGGVLFRVTEEAPPPASDTTWPGVTVLIPAYNEAAVVATSHAGPFDPARAVGAAQALRAQTVALARGPRGRGVVWDIPREPVS